MSSMTREKLICEAEKLMRQKGYSGFSYADLSKIIGITKASIHHHFPTKEVLGEEVVKWAFTETRAQFDCILAATQNAADQVTAYVSLFEKSYRTGLLPLCCALSAETANLPPNIIEQTSNYFDMQITWLIDVIQHGIKAGDFSDTLKPSDSALLIINLCEGASVVARATGRPEVFASSVQHILLILNK